MDNDLHLNLPGVLALIFDEIIEYYKLLEPVTGVVVSNSAIIAATAILEYRDYCRYCCEYYGVLPVKEDK